ncbi:MAG: hypothetical protein ACRD3G_17610 [Vicinamibacterales bacterium]
MRQIEPRALPDDLDRFDFASRLEKTFDFLIESWVFFHGYTQGMPFKSRAQRRKFAELLVEGKISPETYEEWNRETGGKRLPERVKRSTSTARKKSKSTGRTKNASAKKR